MIILEIHWQHHLPNLLLHQEIKKQTSKPDIIIGNETWLNKNVLSSEVFPSTLFEDVFRNDCDSREGGGVLIAIKKGNTGSIKKKADKKRVQFVPIGM